MTISKFFSKILLTNLAKLPNAACVISYGIFRISSLLNKLQPNNQL